MKLLLVVTILIAVVVAVQVFVIWGLIWFQRKALDRFEYQFFAIWHFVMLIFGMISILAGWWLRTASFQDASVTGYVLMAMGVTALLWLLIRNCRKTGLLYGGIGTALEVAVSPWIFSLGLFIVPCLFIGGAQLLTAKPVRIVNQTW